MLQPARGTNAVMGEATKRVEDYRKLQQRWRDRNMGRRGNNAEGEWLKAPLAVLEDRDRRLRMQPMPMGEPLPGYSALDKKLRAAKE